MWVLAKQRLGSRSVHRKSRVRGHCQKPECRFHRPAWLDPQAKIALPMHFANDLRPFPHRLVKSRQMRLWRIVRETA